MNDTEKLIRDLRLLGKYSELEPNWLVVAADKIEELSSRVDVVRCKDCKHSTEKQGFENHMWNDDCVMCDHIAPSNRIPMNKNDFCSYGERKESV